MNLLQMIKEMETNEDKQQVMVHILSRLWGEDGDARLLPATGDEETLRKICQLCLFQVRTSTASLSRYVTWGNLIDADTITQEVSELEEKDSLMFFTYAMIIIVSALLADKEG